MQVHIGIPETGATATVAEIIDTHTNVVTMLLTTYVGLFNSEGDKLLVLPVEYNLAELPIPNTDELWQIVMPTLEAYQADNPVLS